MIAEKRIAFLMSSMGRGGAERVVSILSREYCDLGWNVDICMLLHNINTYDLDGRVRVLDFSYEKEPKALRTVKMLRSLRQYICGCKPQVVVPFLAKTSVLYDVATLGTTPRKYRLVTSERIDPHSVHYSKPLRILIHLAYTKADLVVFQTKRARAYYAKRIQAKSRIIGNPIRVTEPASGERENRIVTAGRLTEQKNHEMLIRAFDAFHKQNPGYSLEIYGEGPLKSRLLEQIQSLGLGGSVRLCGNVPDIHHRISHAALFVLPSNYEGLSNALLEAMMMGLPVISTNCAGSDEVIEDGINGLLTPVGDTDALQKAMERVLGDRRFAAALGENAKASVQRFSVENVIGQWEAAIEGRE